MNFVHYQPQFLGPEAGSANAARGWCEALVRAGHHVVVLVDGDMPRPRPAPPGVETQAIRHALRGALRIPNGFSAHLEGADVVVLHGGWLLGNVVAGKACRREGVPFVVTTHGVYLPEVLSKGTIRKRVWASVLERDHLRRALAVHVFFDEEAWSLPRMRADVRTIIAPNGVTVPGDLAWDGGSGGYLLWLGRFDPAHKGLDLLVRAMAEVPSAGRPELRLHGPDWRGQKDVVRRLVRDLSLDRWIKIGDPVYGDDKWDLIHRAAAFVYPSRWDACPVSVAEAAGIGLPMVVARYPLGSYLAARGAALQVDPDASSIAKGIQAVRSSTAREIGARARQVARDSLSWNAVAQSWLSQLQALLKGSSSQGERPPGIPRSG